MINLFLPIFSKHSQENNSIYWCESKFNFILNMRKSIKCLIPMRMWAISRSHSLFIQFYESYSHNIVDGSLGIFIKIDLFLQCLQKFYEGRGSKKNWAVNPTYLKNGLSVSIKLFYSFYFISHQFDVIIRTLFKWKISKLSFLWSGITFILIRMMRKHFKA